MEELRTIEDINKALADFVPNSRNPITYNLDRMHMLMDYLDNPQNKLKVIHVAGTSGKTSTCYYIASLLVQDGKKVGLTVSPHINSVNERVQINMVPLEESYFAKSLSEFLEIIKQSKVTPSYFETLVAFAYWEFHRQKVDYAVIEVGLGGLLDGTNIVTRQDKVCVLTDIGLDHVNILGSTMKEIAKQKAGIIKEGNEVFCNAQNDEVLNVFKAEAKKKHAKLSIIKQNIETNYDFLPLFQKRNFNLAKYVYEYVVNRDKLKSLKDDQLTLAARTLIPARMEEIKKGNQIIILDGAHNAQKLENLRLSISGKYPTKKVAAMISFVDGRGYRVSSSLEEVSKITDELIITTFKKARQDLPYGPLDPDKIASEAKELNFKQIEVINDPVLAYKKLLEKKEPILLITGSFYIMEDLRMEILKL